MAVLLATVGLNVALFAILPKEFFPQQDTGRLVGSIQADQSISFQLMRKKLAQLIGIVQRDPAVGSIGNVQGGTVASVSNPLYSTKSRPDRLSLRLLKSEGAESRRNDAQRGPWPCARR
jgi:multidrug efflux pump